MKRILPTAIAIAVGIIVLMGYFFEGGTITALRVVLTGWAATLAGLAVLLGIINVLLVNARRLDQRAKGSLYNLLTIAAVAVTLVIGLIEGRLLDGTALYRSSSATNLLFNGVIVASQAALASLVMFALVFAAIRILDRTATRWTYLFVGAVVIGLIGWIPLLGVVNTAYEWLVAVPVTGGVRGILIGVALGTIVIGVRVLTGSERPYTE
ncbi:MAG: hypothetical protein GYB64_14145 [Chloroflexi bacterium]|nr:hypothetical protein [Chloroflexota bacterium]